MSELRLEIETIKDLFANQPLMRMVLEDLLTSGDCFVLLNNGYDFSQLLPANTMRVTATAYEQVVDGAVIATFTDDQVLHLCRKSLKEVCSRSDPKG